MRSNSIPTNSFEVLSKIDLLYSALGTYNHDSKYEDLIIQYSYFSSVR